MSLSGSFEQRTVRARVRPPELSDTVVRGLARAAMSRAPFSRHRHGLDLVKPNGS
jgi:hypothetical protein